MKSYVYQNSIPKYKKEYVLILEFEDGWLLASQVDKDS